MLVEILQDCPEAHEYAALVTRPGHEVRIVDVGEKGIGSDTILVDGSFYYIAYQPRPLVIEVTHPSWHHTFSTWFGMMRGR